MKIYPFIFMKLEARNTFDFIKNNCKEFILIIVSRNTDNNKKVTQCNANQLV